MVDRETVLLEDDAARRRRAEAIDRKDVPVGADPALPAHRSCRLDGEPRFDLSRQHALAVLLALLREELPRRHRHQAYLDAATAQELLGADDERYLRARADE